MKINISQLYRHFLRKKKYVLINILGLGIGLGCVILISSFILHEFSFDNYHKNATRIYRVIEGTECNTVYAMGEAFKGQIPEIETVARIYRDESAQIDNGDTYTKEVDFYFADQSLLKLLDIKIVSGNEKYLLNEPNSIIISETIASKYFGTQNLVGKSLNVLVSNNEMMLKINGVYKDFPTNSSLQAHILCDMETAFPLFVDIGYSIGFENEKRIVDFKNQWDKNEFQTLIMVRPGADEKYIAKKCSEICLQHRGEEMFKEISLQKYNSIYLHSAEYNSEEFRTSHVESLKIFLMIGLLVLLIAIINYILISNADNNSSIKEIACRKVLGASKVYIIGSLLLKSCTLSFLSLIPAIFFVKVTIPLFNSYFQQNIHFNLFFSWPYPILLIGVVLFTGIIAGLYLGFKAWKINPVHGFKRKIVAHRKSLAFDSALIIAQFAVFILLAVCSITIYNQYKFSINKDLGFTTKDLIVLDVMEDELNSYSGSIQDYALSLPHVKNCIPMSFMIPPTDNVLLVSYRDKETNTKQQEQILLFSQNAAEMMDIDIVDGVSFTESTVKDRNNILLNETAAKAYKLKAGDKMSHFNVIGITRDFHYRSLHEKIGPILIIPQIKNLPYLLVKTDGYNDKVISQLKNYYADISIEHKFECETLDERIERFYQKEKKETRIMVFFFAISLTLSVMGLIGFVSLKLIGRTKEIGVRKVNGAKTKEILSMLNTDFIKWVGFAFVIACPVGWYSMTKWLENFAYKAELSWWIFAVAGGITLLIALITVSWQSWRAANRNPVEALRYE